MRFSGHVLPESKRGAAGGEAGCLHHDHQLSCLTPYFTGDDAIHIVSWASLRSAPTYRLPRLRLLRARSDLHPTLLAEWCPLFKSKSSLLVFCIHNKTV